MKMLRHLGIMNNSLTIKQFQFEMVMKSLFLVCINIDNVTISNSVH